MLRNKLLIFVIFHFVQIDNISVHIIRLIVYASPDSSIASLGDLNTIWGPYGAAAVKTFIYISF